MSLKSSELDGYEQQIASQLERNGHQALYSRHTCRECGLDWTCRQPTCRLHQEGILCRACEVEALLSEVLNLVDGLAPVLKTLGIGRNRLAALREDAMRIVGMERI